MAWLVPTGLSVALASGCGGEGPSLPPSVELGTGFDAFVPLDAGDEIEVTQGPQGGFHVLASVRVTGLSPGDRDDLNDPDNPTTEFRVTAGAMRLDSGLATYQQGLVPVGDGVYEMLGRRVILDITADDQVAGQMITLSTTISDERGRRVSDSVELLAVADPLNP